MTNSWIKRKKISGYEKHTQNPSEVHELPCIAGKIETKIDKHSEGCGSLNSQNEPHVVSLNSHDSHTECLGSIIHHQRIVCQGKRLR